MKPGDLVRYESFVHVDDIIVKRSNVGIIVDVVPWERESGDTVPFIRVLKSDGSTFTSSVEALQEL